MRPISRGLAPKRYTQHGDAYPDLCDHIGRYCSYCEAPLKNGEVEHVLPQHHFPALALSWNNFLLGCKNCNATKGAWPGATAGRAAAVWPDTDNTARAFVYQHGHPPTVAAAGASGLTPADVALADALRIHTGIDRDPTHPRFSAKDDRWEMRDTAWLKAQEALSNLTGADTPAHRRTIAAIAAATGFWSVWRAVFSGDPDMLSCLNAAFTGTDPACFDTRSRPVPRSGGRI